MNDKTKRSNADRIRAMSDEELAERLMEATERPLDIPFCQRKRECRCNLGGITDDECMRCLVEWLKAPAEEG